MYVDRLVGNLITCGETHADITKSGSISLVILDVNAGQLLIRPSGEKHVTGSKGSPVLKCIDIKSHVVT